jgi:hypothetical protein
MSERPSGWAAAVLWRMLSFIVGSVLVVWLSGKVLDAVWKRHGGDAWLQRALDVPVGKWVSRLAADYPRVAPAIPYLVVVPVVVPVVAAVGYFAYVRRRRASEPRRGHSVMRDLRIARDLRGEREQERRRRDVEDLEALLESGRVALDALEREPERPKVFGSTAPAAPLYPVTYRGYEMDAWSGLVVQKLKGVRPAELAAELERYFQDCLAHRDPVERGRCYLDRLGKIAGRLRP